MAIHMAIGLLFLGGGMATLSQTNEAIAALLCAFFPVFPCNMADNKLHFQGAGRVVLGIPIPLCSLGVSITWCSLGMLISQCRMLN
jgi:hypothetical protein